MRIASFRHKGLQRFYEKGQSRGLDTKLVPKIAVVLHAIEQAEHVEQIAKLPGWRLHPLKGSRRGNWSIWLTGNFRLTFTIDGKIVTNLDLEDYH